EQLFDAAVVKKHLLKPAREFLQQQNEVTKILEALDFDPFEDLTSITVALTTLGNEAKGLIIVHGDFDETLFAEKAEELAKETGNLVKIHHAGQQTIYELHPEGSGKPLFVGIVDDTTIVAGPEKRFIGDAFIKSRSEKPARVKKELRE